MQQKEIILVNKGMRRDLSVSKTGESSAYDNRNIRITATDKDTLLSVTNERGNRKIDSLSFSGTLIGHAVLNDYIVLFTAEGSASRIYRVHYDGSTFSGILLYEGKLGFDTEHPIETIVDYETEDIQKVYWLDGKNVLRFINISDTYLEAHLEHGYTLDNPKFTFAGYNDWFDSTRSSVATPAVTLTKDNSGNSRANGVTQYFMTYYNKNGQQTGIIYSSPLVYLAPEGRGGAADQTNSNRVVLSVTGLDKTFEYVRLYSITRTALDGTAVGYIVADSSIVDGEATFVDDGAHLETVDPASFLYLGSSDAVFGTMTQKDGTLFLGNIKSAGYAGIDVLETAIEKNAFILSGDDFKDGTDWESAIVSFRYSTENDMNSPVCHIPHVYVDGYYPYSSQLQYTNAQISTFKGGEKYRFALRFVRSNGTMSKPFWIGDKVNPYYPVMTFSKYVARAVVSCVVPDAIADAAEKAGFNSAQLMIAQATYSDRSVKAQGIVSPTVFNLYDRISGRNFVQSSWIYRPRLGEYPYRHLSVLNNSDSRYAELQCNWWDASADGDEGPTGKDNTPSPLYVLDDDGALVNPPAGMLSYRFIRITATFQAVRTSYFGTFCFHASITVSRRTGTENTFNVETRTVWGRDGSFKTARATFIARFLEVQDELQIPTKYKLDESALYGKVHEAADKCKLYKTGYAYYDPGEIDEEPSVTDQSLSFSRLLRQYYFVDESVVTLNSPEISYEAVSLDRNSGLKFRIVGAALMTGDMSDYSVNTEKREYPGNNSLPYQFSQQNISENIEGLSAWPLYAEYRYEKKDGTDDEYETVKAPGNYMMYMWHKSGSIPSYGDSSDGTMWSMLTDKLFANLHFSCYSIFNNYGDGHWSVSPSDIRQVSSAGADSYELRRGSDTVVYSANIDTAVLVPDGVKYPVYLSEQVYAPEDTPVLNYVRTVSDPVNITYASGAHLIVGLPTGVNDTILPYMNEEERFGLPTDAGAVHAPWLGRSVSGNLLYRIVKPFSDSSKVADLTEGAFGTFDVLELNSVTRLVTMRVSADGMSEETLAAYDALLDTVQKQGKSVYAHILYDNGWTDKVILADAFAMSDDETTVVVTLIGKNLFISLSSGAAMSSISIQLVKGDTVLVSTSVTFDSGVTQRYFSLDRPYYDDDMYLKYTVCYEDTYTVSGSEMPVVPDLEAQVAVPNKLFGIRMASTRRYFFLRSARYIDPTEAGVEKTFTNIATSDNYRFVLKDGVMTNAGTVIDEYKQPTQGRFVLSNTALMTEAKKYMYIGELYYDYDAEAKDDPSLDTRYGGITESSVEGNTFIAAGPRTSLSYREHVDEYAQAEIESDMLFDYLLGKASASNSKCSLQLATVNNNILEKIDLTSLSGLTAYDMLPTSSNKVSGLHVEIADGGWVSSISGLDERLVSIITESSDYKIAVLRNGYARRGKWRKFTNKYGDVQTSHTSRISASYRKKRRGYSNSLPACHLRIIGMDLLIANNQSGSRDFKLHSQTFMSFYKDSTLITALGGSLKLPAVIDSDGKPSFNTTRDNRFSQRSARDLTELFIGLYHKEGNFWRLASNVVQVRGRNDERTQVWEFDKSNVIAQTGA